MVLPEHDDFRLTVRRFARVDEQGEVSPRFDEKRWRGLAGLGVLGLGTSGGGGGPIEIASAMEELGAAGFVGPLVEGFIASHALAGPNASGLATGGVAAVTWDEAIVPWGERASVVLFVDPSDEVWLCRSSSLEPVETLGRDQWARGHLERVSGIGTQPRAMAIGEVSVSAYVLGAAQRMIELSAEYARARRQFGKAIGEFQAVSHPLARCFARLRSARDLLERAVNQLSVGSPEDLLMAARSRLLATQGAQEASQIALQVHGGMGFVEGTLLSHLARRIRHVSLLGPPLSRSIHTSFSAAFPQRIHRVDH